MKKFYSSLEVIQLLVEKHPAVLLGSSELGCLQLIPDSFNFFLNPISLELAGDKHSISTHHLFWAQFASLGAHNRHSESFNRKNALRQLDRSYFSLWFYKLPGVESVSAWTRLRFYSLVTQPGLDLDRNSTLFSTPHPHTSPTLQQILMLDEAVIKGNKMQFCV